MLLRYVFLTPASSEAIADSSVRFAPEAFAKMHRWSICLLWYLSGSSTLRGEALGHTAYPRLLCGASGLTLLVLALSVCFLVSSS